MHAVTIVDGALDWREHPDPVPGRARCSFGCGLPASTAPTGCSSPGFYPAPPGSPPDIPGLELAGEVAALGPGTSDGTARFAVGDRVMAVVGGGGQAELCVVHERHLLPVPDGVDWAAAGGFPEVFTTAHDALFTQCRPGGRRASLRARRRRWRRHRGRAAGGRRGMRGGGDGSQRVAARRRRRHSAPRAVEPEGFGRPRTIRRRARAGRRHQPRRGRRSRWPPAGASPSSASAPGPRPSSTCSTSWASAAASTARRSAPAASRTRPPPPAPSSATCSRCWPSGRVRVPVEATFPMADAAAAYERFAAGGKLGKIVLVSDA